MRPATAGELVDGSVDVSVDVTPPAARGFHDVTPDAPTDAWLVRRVLDGDARAFGALVDRHAPACLRFAAHLLGDRDDAEDVVQETLLRAYRALARYDEREQFRAWLFAILVNRCRTAGLRRARRRRWLGTRVETAPERAVAPEAEDVAFRDALGRALDGLEPAAREAFLLKHVEELSYDEMAAITGVGVSALKMRVKRACERLRALLREVSDVGC